MVEAQSVPKILIADDNPQNVELLEAYLAGLDCELRTAADGEETLRAVQQWRPDLLLLDVMMPRLSGFEVCKKLRADAATRDTLILIVTALNGMTPRASPSSWPHDPWTGRALQGTAHSRRRTRQLDCRGRRRWRGSRARR